MYDQPLLTDDEIQRLVMEHLMVHDSVTEEDIAIVVKEMNGSIMSAELVDMWRTGWLTAIVRDGAVHYNLTPAGCEAFDRWRNEDR